MDVLSTDVTREAEKPPSGTVTFLFTDIEGSTRLLERLREQYATVVADERDLLRAAFARWGGHEIDTQGDSFFVAFARAADAIGCVIEAQGALADHAWPEGVTVRVRMGLHTGEPIVSHTGYIGMDVHRAARIAAAGYGGQVLLSQTTRDLVYQDLPAGATLRDLGAHKLKDIRHAQQIFQLDIEGLPCEFPPIKTLATEEEAPAPGQPPFKGLQYFDEADAALFFGRGQITARLASAVRDLRFLAVIGASGSGKSSVVRAGLVPALKHSEPDRWQVVVLTPGAHPLEALAIQMTKQAESVTATATLLDDLTRETRSLHLYARRMLASHSGGPGGAGHAASDDRRVLLVVDQFEELFTLCRDEAERRAFVDNLLYAANAPDGPVRVVIALRADFYEHLAEYAELRQAVAGHQEYLGAMSAEELRQAIEEPARQGGWEFSPGLVELMLHDVGAEGDRQPEPGALPLLSHALFETWKHRRGNLMNLKAYSESGGVRRAIARTAETVYAQELSPSQREIARNIFLRLTELGEGTQDTRRRAFLQELYPPAPHGDPQDVKEVLLKLVDARLITTGEGTAEVAHEALIREWPTLREWLAADREGIRLHRHLTEAAQEWELLDHDPGALYRGARLSQALEWALANPRAPNAQEQAFLEASREDAAREQAEREAIRQRELEAARKLAATERQATQEAERSARRLRQRAYGLAAAFVLVLALAGASFYLANRARASALAAEQNAALAGTNAQRAEAEQRIATGRELAAAAASNLSVDPERSILLALQAVSTTATDGTVLPEAEAALHGAVEASRVRYTVRGPAKGLWGVTVAPDGSQATTLGLDGTAMLWDVATGTQLRSLGSDNSTDALGTGAAYAPDGRHLLLAAGDNTARLWDLKTGQVVLTLAGHQDAVHSVAISADGKTYATASADKTAKLWDAATGKERLTLTGHEGSVDVLALSPDGRRVYTGSDDDGMAIAWDAATGKQLYTFSGQPLTGGGTGVDAIAVSPDGKRVATGEFDTTVRIWDDAGKLLHTLFGHSSQVVSVAFSPDGKYLASGSEDGVAKLWDAATGQEVLRLAGHTSGVLGVAFTPDGSQLLTTSRDGTARAWDISANGSREWLTLAAHAGLVDSVAYSPDGTRLATWGRDGAAKVWDAESGRLLVTVEHRPEAAMGNATYSPDGKRLALAGGRTLRIVDASSGRELLAFPELDDEADGVAFSPDGVRVAVGFFGGKARIYDSGSGALLKDLSGNPGQIKQITFSPNGGLVAAAGDDGTARLWDAISGQELVALKDGVRVNGITFSPDGKRVATSGNDGTVKLWDASTGERLLTLRGHSGTTFGVAFSPDGKQLATSSVDRTVKLWTLPRPGEELAEPLTLFGHTGSVYRIAFSPDGRRLATASRDGSSRVYALPIADLVALARQRVTRGLTQDECAKYLHVSQCPPVP